VQLALGNLGCAPAEPDRLADTANGLVVVVAVEELPATPG
jgi:hypothetical protein